MVESLVNSKNNETNPVIRAVSIRQYAYWAFLVHDGCHWLICTCNTKRKTFKLSFFGFVVFSFFFSRGFALDRDEA